MRQTLMKGGAVCCLAAPAPWLRRHARGLAVLGVRPLLNRRCPPFWRPLSSAVAGAPSPAASTAGDADKKPEEKKGGWGSIILYVTSGVSSAFVLWHFYKSGYSLHKTESSLLDSWRSLPMYWPPGPSAAAKNSRLDPEGLRPEVFDAFVQWFLANDLMQPEGVLRDDVLELLDELGFSEKEKPIREFLLRGGHDMLDEHRRLTGCGLQESVSLLAKLAHLPPPTEEEDPRPVLGDKAVATMRRKLGVSSVTSNAAALMQAMQQPSAPPTDAALAAPAPATTPAPLCGAGHACADCHPAQAAPLTPPAAPSVLADVAEADDDFDEVMQQRLEVARLTRLEEELTARLHRNGSLSPAEEARLSDTRRSKAKLAMA